MHSSQAVALQLEKIEVQMKQLALWSVQVPHQDQLASVQPFACDTLRLEQWLQFILLPRLRSMLQKAQPLPRVMAVAPAAEMALPPAAQPLIILLEELDLLINEGVSPAQQEVL